MRRFQCATAVIAMAIATIPAPADAQTIVYRERQSGLNLPSAPRPNGFDEVRTSDGTVCRSAMGGNGAYLDFGGIGGQASDGDFDTASIYGRVVVPLGRQPKRVDCSVLYQLEIERLQMELRAARAGLESAGDNWNNQ